MSRRLPATLCALASLTASVLLPAGSAAAVSPLTKLGSEFRRTYGVYNVNGAITLPMSSPAIGDVTGDGIDDIVVGGMDGWLVVLTSDGSGVQQRSVLVGDGSAAIQATPALADLNGDGVLDVVVASLRNVPGQSRVIAYNMRPLTPQVLFTATDSGLAPASGFLGTPAVGDINGDGSPDIVAAGLDHRIHAWGLNGAELPGFPVYSYDTSLSSAALADVDRDGRPEIVVGADMDFGQPLPPGGYLWVLRGDGTSLPGYPMHLGSEVIWSSPAIADLNGDGWLDAIVGTGQNFVNADSTKLYAITLATATAVPGWPQVLGSFTTPSPAVADVDGNGRLSVLEATSGGWIYAFNSDGTLRWRSCGLNFSSCPIDPRYASVISSPAVADVDGDGTAEVLYVGERQLKVLDAKTGAVKQSLPLRSISATQFTHPGASSAAVANVNGRTLVALNVAENDNATVAPDAGDQQAVYLFQSATPSSNLPWPMFHGSLDRWGLYGRLAPAAYTRYIDAVYTKLLGRPADPGGSPYWAQLLSNGLPRPSFTGALARSDEWVGHVIDTLYRQVFGRPPDAAGLAYWRDLVKRGLRVSTVASYFYGSDEFFAARGSTNAGLVDALYTSILGRSPDSGRDYWIGLLDRGAPRTDVSGAFYLSYESNGRRVDALYSQLLGRASDPSGRDYWARQLSAIDDVVLAALLTGSDEFFSRNR